MQALGEPGSAGRVGLVATSKGTGLVFTRVCSEQAMSSPLPNLAATFFPEAA